MSIRSAQSTWRISDHEWEAQKPVLQRLWLDEGKPLTGKGGVEMMMKEHHFYAT